MHVCAAVKILAFICDAGFTSKEAAQVSLPNTG